MADYKIAEFFAKLTFKLDNKDLDAFEKNLRNLENRIMVLDKRLTGKFEKIQKGMAQTQLARKRQLDIELKESKLVTERMKTGMRSLALKEREIRTHAKKQRLDKLDLTVIKQQGIFNRQRLSDEAKAAREVARQKNWANNAELRAIKLREREDARMASRSRKRVTNVGTAHEMALVENERRSRRGGGSSRSNAFIGAGMGASAMSWGRGFIPGLGGAFAVSQLNTINQDLVGQQIALNAVTGSPEAGANSMAWVKGMSQQLGLSYRGTTPSYTKMLASGQASGFNEDQVRNVFEGLAQYGRVLNLDSESMKGTMRGVEQIFSKGQVMSEELKGQIAERMPGAIPLMARAAGRYFNKEVTPADLMKLMEDGKVPSAVLNEFGTILKEEVKRGGQLEEAMRSSAAQQQRFNNAFSDFVLLLGKSGFDRGMSRIFKSLADMLEKNKGVAEGLGKAWDKFSIVIERASKSVNDIYETFKLLNKEIPYFTEGLLLVFGAGTPLGRMVVAFTTFAAVLEDIFMYIADPNADTVMGSIFGSESEQIRVIAGAGTLAATLLGMYGTLKLINAIGGKPDLPGGKKGGIMSGVLDFAKKHPYIAAPVLPAIPAIGAGMLLNHVGGNTGLGGMNGLDPVEQHRRKTAMDQWNTDHGMGRKYKLPSTPTPSINSPINIELNIGNMTDVNGLEQWVQEVLPNKLREIQTKEYSLLLSEYQNK